jgi:hypothetical protein
MNTRLVRAEKGLREIAVDNAVTVTALH